MTFAERVEHLIAPTPREVSCTLFLVAFYLGVSLLFAHLSWGIGTDSSPVAASGVGAHGMRPYIRARIIFA